MLREESAAVEVQRSCVAVEHVVVRDQLRQLHHQPALHPSPRLPLEGRALVRAEQDVVWVAGLVVPEQVVSDQASILREGKLIDSKFCFF